MIYVCIRCRFHYGPVAQVRSFQEHRGDLIRLSLITGHMGNRETTDGGEKKKREEAYLQPEHTPHPQGESKLQSALQDHGGSQTGVRLKDEWERKRGAGRKRWQEKCEYVSVDNCGQLCTLLGCVWIPVYHADASFSAKKGLTALKYVLQSICIL